MLPSSSRFWFRKLTLAGVLSGCAANVTPEIPVDSAAVAGVAPAGAVVQVGAVPEPLAEPAGTPTMVAAVQTGAQDPPRPPNLMGRIPVLEYHLVGEVEGRWARSRERFRQDLEMLYARGYRPVTISQLVDREIDLAAGLSPVVFTFDDASPGQFSYIERDGELIVDPQSAMGIWLDFARTHPGWENRAVFCLLSGAEAGRSFFGDKGIEGQKSAWRFAKVRFLAEQGFELCNHTLWHANLGNYGDDFVQEQIARGAMAIDSAVPGYKVRTFSLPLGIWPKNRELARTGSWTDPKSGRVVSYSHDAILLVSGNPVVSPHDNRFDPLRLERVQVFGEELERTLDRLDGPGGRYVSAGSVGASAGPRGRSAPQPY